VSIDFSKIQRPHKLTRKIAPALVLLNAGFSPASEISRLGKDEFIDRMTSELNGDKGTAELIYRLVKKELDK